MYQNNKYIVNGYLPWSRIPVPVIKQMMTTICTSALAGDYERGFSKNGIYHITGHQIICPCPELINFCAEDHIMLNPQVLTTEDLNLYRGVVRMVHKETTPEMFWDEMRSFIASDKLGYHIGFPDDKKTGKCIVSEVKDREKACVTIMYFAKKYKYQAVCPKVRNPLSKEDENALCGLPKQPKLSKADRKMMRRAKKQKPKQKKQKKQKKNKKYANKTAEQNRKFEILQLMRKLGLEKTIV